jgi:hypothetical protein
MADNSFLLTISKIFNGQGLGADFLETDAFWDILEKNAEMSVSIVRLLHLCVEAGFHRRVSAAGSRTDILLLSRDLQKYYFIAPDAAETILALLVFLLRPKNPVLMPKTVKTTMSYLNPVSVDDLHKLPPQGNTVAEDRFLFFNETTFTMGEPGGSIYEHLKPHTVTVAPFYICEFPVRQSAYYEVINYNPSYFIGAALPAAGISWYNAVDYCNKRSISEGLKPVYDIDTTPNLQNIYFYDTCKWTVKLIAGADGFRLPTDAEWECSYSSFKTDKNIREWCWDLWPETGIGPQFDRTLHISKNSWHKSCESPSGCRPMPYIGSLGFRLARTAL